MNLAKQSTAKSFLVGPILDADGAAKTDEVIGSIKVTKNGSVGAPNGSSTLTHSHTGHYVYDAAAGDFDALGEVEFSLNSGTNAMAPVKFQVVPANVYDSLVSGSDALQVNTIQVGGTVQTAGDVPGLLTNATYGLDKLARTGADSDTLETLSDQIDGITGTGGAYTQSLTVVDGDAAAIPNARVYLYSGSILIDQDTTDADGAAAVTADAGDYTLRVRASGYSSHDAALTVAADATLDDIELEAITFTPPTDEDKVTAWSYVYDEDSAVEPDATLMMQQVSAGARNIYDGKVKTLTADGTGLVSCTVWADGSEYRISRDGYTWSDPFAPEDDEDPDLPLSYRLPGVVGNS